MAAAVYCKSQGCVRRLRAGNISAKLQSHALNGLSCTNALNCRKTKNRRLVTFLMFFVISAHFHFSEERVSPLAVTLRKGGNGV